MILLLFYLPVTSSGPINASVVISGLRDYLWSTEFLVYSDLKALENVTKVGERNACVQRWLELLCVYSYTLECRKRSSNGNAYFLSRLPQPVTDLDRTVPNCLTSPDAVCIHVIQACGFTEIEPFTPGIGLGGSSHLPPAASTPSPLSAVHQQRFRRLPLPRTAHGHLRFVAVIAAPNPAA